jgi:Acyclic terpene utilisation family protein AtuA
LEPIIVLAATGMLGTGFSEKSFYQALEEKPHVIGCDAGSTDPGPYYLGSDSTMSSYESVKRDLKIMITAGVTRGIPVIVGSAGTSGTNSMVDWVAGIVEEIGREEELNFNLATIYSEVTPDKLQTYFNDEKLKPLENAPALTSEKIGDLKRIVGQMGPEPYIEALDKGANVIIAGRSSDTSIYSAVPIRAGLDSASVWHAAKILECGAGCVETRIHPDCMLAYVYPEKFVIGPPNLDMKCTPVSVLSHFLYENTDPYNLVESTGTLDTSKATYTQYSDQSVKVEKSLFKTAEKHTIRLEGVESTGFRRVCIGGIRDPKVLTQLDHFIEEVTGVIKKKVRESLTIEEKEYELLFRSYGHSGVLGKNEPLQNSSGHEVGLLIEVLADTPEQSKAIMSVAWHTILHHPIKEWSGLVSQIAFPFSPPDMDMGESYRFVLNHIVEVEDPCELFEVKMHEVLGKGDE